MPGRETKQHNKEEKAVHKVTPAERTAVDKHFARREAKPQIRFKISKNGPGPQADLDWRPHGVMTAIWGRGPKILWDVGRSQRFLQSDISDGEVCWGDGRSHRACSA
jgi:hypothetical protein